MFTYELTNTIYECDEVSYTILYISSYKLRNLCTGVLVFCIRQILTFPHRAASAMR